MKPELGGRLDLVAAMAAGLSAGERLKAAALVWPDAKLSVMPAGTEK